MNVCRKDQNFPKGIKFTNDGVPQLKTDSYLKKLVNKKKLADYAKIIGKNVSSKTVYVSTLNPNTDICPVCNHVLSPADKNCRRCITCLSYLRYHNETLKEIIDIRTNHTLGSYSLIHNPVLFVGYVEANSSDIYCVWSVGSHW